MRRVAQNFPSVLICSSLRMLAGVNVLHHDRAAGAANSRHFAKDLQWRQKMMQREPAHYYIELPVFEGQVLRVSGTKRYIRNAVLLRTLFGDGEHGIREVDTDNLSRRASKCFSDIAGACRDIQHALGAGEMGRGHQAPDALFVSNPRIRRKGLSLRRERLPNDVVV